MGRVKSYAKHIACLESFWTVDIEKRLSVHPVLELLGKCNGIKSVILTCNTIHEFKFNLDIVVGDGRNGCKTIRGVFL